MKKQLTPEEAVKRLKIISLAIICMIVILFMMNIGNKKKPVPKKDPVEQKMDIQLDSIIKVDYPDGTKVINTGVIEKLSIDEGKHRKEKMAIIRYKIAQDDIKTDPEMLQDLKLKADEAQRKMDEDSKKDRYAYFRNVIFELPDSTQKSAYQKTTEQLDSSNFITVITINKNNNFKIYENVDILQ